MLGVAKQKAILDRYNELAMNYSDETADEMTQAAGRDRGRRACGISTARSSRRWTRCAARRDDADVDQAVGRRAPPRRAVQAAAREARPAAARRADQPSRRRDASTGWKATCATIPGAILIVTHDRYFLDNVTGWILELDRGKGIPYEGNYSAWLEAEAEAPGAGGAARTPRASARSRASSEWIAPSPKARQAKSKARYPAL